ncbi:MAG: hypothetical protein OXC08_10035 [Thiotrichales bacterium]|nr:hypothetical protein [Thiotrichales bacterium]
MKSFATATGFLRSARATSALEYALVVAVVVTVIAAALVTFGGHFGPAFTKIGQEVIESSGEVVD